MSTLLLRLNRPDGDTDVYHLKSCRRYHLGRGSQCEVRILDMKMSRRHCAIEMIGGQWLLLDCGSTNGVKLNGERIGDSARLRPDAVIEAGSSTLVVTAIEGLDSSDAFAVADISSDVTGPQTAQIIDTTALEPSSSACRPAIIGDEDLTPVRNETSADDDQPQDSSPEDPSEADDDYQPAPSPTESPDDQSEDQQHGEAQPAVSEASAQPEEPAAPQEPEHCEESEAPHAVPSAAPSPDESQQAGGGSDEDPFADVDSGPLHPGDERHVGTDRHGRPITLRVGSVGQQRPPEPSAGTAAAERTVIITLLGHKIGPIPRSVARDLKARELRGTLSEDDLRDQPRPA